MFINKCWCKIILIAVAAFLMLVPKIYAQRDTLHAFKTISLPLDSGKSVLLHPLHSITLYGMLNMDTRKMNQASFSSFRYLPEYPKSNSSDILNLAGSVLLQYFKYKTEPSHYSGIFQQPAYIR